MSANPTVTKNPDVTDPSMRSHIRALTKLLIGTEDRTGAQVTPIRREDLPADMRDREGHVLDAIYYCTDTGIAPTLENVLGVMAAAKRLQNPAEFVGKLIEESKDDTHGIRELSAFISYWLKERSLRDAAAVIGAIANDPFMDYGDKWDKMHQLFLKTSPGDSFLRSNVSESDFKDLTLMENQAMLKAKAEGLAYGVQLPWQIAQLYFEYLEWGQGTLAMGGTGVGKTTWGQIVAEYIAWKQKLKCDVAYFGLETPLEVLSRRQFSRHHAVTYNDIKSGRVNLADERWKPVWDKWKAKTKERANEFGYIKHFYSPDASVTDIIAEMGRAAETSRRLGRSIVFFIDHLHSIDWEATHGRMKEFDALRSIVRMLYGKVNKINASGVRTHIFVLAQEGNEKGQAFGGKFMSKRAQLVISLQRERFGPPDEATGNYPGAAADFKMTKKAHELTDAQKNSPWYRKSKEDPSVYEELDALGQPRYWYRAGDEYSHKGVMRFTKSNDSPPALLRTQWEATMNMIYEDPAQIAELQKAGRLKPSGVK